MYALVLESYNNLVYKEVPEPKIGPQDVLVRVKACGICGSDIHGMDGSSGRRIPPIIMGHEAAGIICAVGDAVEGWKAGDRVTFDSTISCGECFYCRRGQINLCDNRRVLGVSCGDYRQDGAFAEYVAVPARILYRLPTEVSFEQAAMIEPVSIAFHAVNRTPVTINDTAVVVGAGMIGLLVIQTLRLAGCGKIIAVDIEPSRLEMARQMGADTGILANRPDYREAVRSITEGRGADLAVDVAGNTASLQTAMLSLRKGGALTLIGNLSANVEFLLQTAVTGELTIYGSCASNGEYPACIDMLSRGVIDVAPLMSAKAPLAEGAEWFQRLYSKQSDLMKVILEP